MSHSVSTKPYQFRASTVENHAQAHSQPRQLQGRKILPLNQTPTLIATSTDRVVDAEICKIKVTHDLFTHYISALLEECLDAPLESAQTKYQGDRAKKGNQAAHGSKLKEPKDKLKKKFADRIIAIGVTPNKAKPILKNHCSSPEIKQLHERHQDEPYVREFLENRMPSENHSTLTNTRFHFNCNATFENPDESNQYDTHMERKIAPFLKELQDQRMEGDLSPEESVERNVNWRLKYYSTSIAHLETQLVNIDALSTHFNAMRAFELASLTEDHISEEEFASYLDDVNAFLTCYDALTEKKLGCPSCAEFKSIRNDFSVLRKLQSMAFEKQMPLEDISQFYLSSRRHLGQEMHCDREALATKYGLYLDEAKAQQEATQEFADPCVIPNLSKTLFGIMDNGVRRAPTEEELKTQVFGLFALATPVKEKMAKRQRAVENQENIAPSENHKRPRYPVARNLNF